MRHYSLLFSIGLAVAIVAGAVSPAGAEVATWSGYEKSSRTVSGEVFHPEGFCADYPNHSCTCAHRSFPFRAHVRVSWHGRTVVCRVTDRGPAKRTGADIDLSMNGARTLGIVSLGRARVRIERVETME